MAFALSQKGISISRRLVFICLFLFPFAYLPFFSDPWEMPKLLLLGVLTLCAWAVWLFVVLKEKRLKWRSSAVGGWLLVVSGWWTVSALIADGGSLSWIGGHGQYGQSVVALWLGSGLYWLILQLRDDDWEARAQRVVLLSFVIGLLITAIIIIAQLFDIETLSLLVNPVVDNQLSLGVLLSIVALWLIGRLGEDSGAERWWLIAFVVIDLLLLLVLDLTAVWVVLGITSLAMLFYLALRLHSFSSRQTSWLVLTLAISIIGLVLPLQLWVYRGAYNPLPSFSFGLALAIQQSPINFFIGHGPQNVLDAFADWNASVQAFGGGERVLSVSSQLFDWLLAVGLPGLLFMIVFFYTGLKPYLQRPANEENLTSISLLTAMILSLIVAPISIVLWWWIIVMLALREPLSASVVEKSIAPSGRMQPAWVGVGVLAGSATIVALIFFGRWAGASILDVQARGAVSTENLTALERKLETAKRWDPSEEQYALDLAELRIVQGRKALEDQNAETSKQRFAEATRLLSVYPGTPSKNVLILDRVFELYRSMSEVTLAHGKVFHDFLVAMTSVEPASVLWLERLGEWNLLLAQVPVESQRPIADVQSLLNEAEQAYTQVGEKQPGRVTSVLGRAKVAEMRQDGDAALAILDEGLRSSPNNSDYLLEKGRILRLGGKADEAIEVFKTVNTVYGDQRLALANLALIYEEKKDAANQKDALERLLKLDPNNADAKIKLEALK